VLAAASMFFCCGADTEVRQEVITTSVGLAQDEDSKTATTPGPEEPKEAPKEEVKEQTPQVVPEEPKEAPPTAPVQDVSPGSTFLVNVKKAGQKLGAVLDATQEGCCVVKRLEAGGLLERQNVQSYDRLVSVNGKSQKSSELLKSIGASDDLALKFERPRVQDVKFEKAGKQVGLKLGTDDSHVGLLVKEVIGGIAAELPKGTFTSGARIVEINGKTGATSELLSILRGEEQLSLKVCTYDLSV